MFGFKGIGEMAGNPTYEMVASYPGFEHIYSWVAGLFYILPMSFGGMSLNLLKQGYNRTILMTVMLSLAGATALTQGVINSLSVFIIMRILHACFNSVINPLLFGTIADYFPPD